MTEWQNIIILTIGLKKIDPMVEATLLIIGNTIEIVISLKIASIILDLQGLPGGILLHLETMRRASIRHCRHDALIRLSP